MNSLSVHRQHAFGMQVPGRTYSSTDYRYGFNGMEKDDEAKGAGNQLDFGARIYDPRLGRWLSIDPEQARYPSLSPYHFSGNNPIVYIDVDGKVFVTYIKVKNQETGKTETHKVTFNGVNASIQKMNGKKPVGEATEYSAGTSQFVDDMVTSYNYIVNNGADVDNAMQKVAGSEIEVTVKEKKGGGTYYKGEIVYDFKYGVEIRDDEGFGEHQGNESPALGFWSEVYHAYIDLIDKEAKEKYKNIDEEEHYVHVDKENQVIDKLKEKDPKNSETKRKTYRDGVGLYKSEGPTSTKEKEK